MSEWREMIVPEWRTMITVMTITTFALAAGLMIARVYRRAPASRYAVLVGSLGAALLALISLTLPSVQIATDMAFPGGTQSSPSMADAIGRLALVTLWAIGVTALLARDIRAELSRQRLFAALPLSADPVLATAVVRIARRLGIRNRVEVRIGARSSTPMTDGILRPVLAIPVDHIDWEEAELEAVLLHELMHVARHDVLSDFIARLGLTVAWFHPLAWAAYRQARLERELVCDAAGLSAGIRPWQYAEFLLRTFVGSEAPGVAMAFASAGAFERRVAAVLDKRVSRLNTGVSSRLAIALLVIATTGAGVARFTQPQPVPMFSAVLVDAEPAKQSAGLAVRAPSGEMPRADVSRVRGGPRSVRPPRKSEVRAPRVSAPRPVRPLRYSDRAP